MSWSLALLFSIWMLWSSVCVVIGVDILFRVSRVEPP